VILEGALLVGTDLRDTGLSSANLSSANLTRALLDGADLSGADLTGADLSAAQLRGAVLERTVVHGTILRQADVQNASWNEADVQGGDWTDVNLSGAGFHRVHLVDVNLNRGKLAGVQFDDCDGVRVRFESARMNGLRLIDTTFEDVDLRDVDLTGGEIRFANFERVDFSGSCLDGGEFESVAFRSCVWDRVSAERTTFQRCAGLRTGVQDVLREAGADLALPFILRVWRLLAEVRGARVAIALLVIVLFAFAGQRTAERLAEAPEDAAEAEYLLGSDEATRQEWTALKRRYEEEPEARLEVMFLMADRFERRGFSDEAEKRLRDALADLPAGESHDEDRRQFKKRIAQFLLRQERFEGARVVAEELVKVAPSDSERQVAQGLLVESLVGAGDELIALGDFDLAFDYARTIIDGSLSAEQQAPGYLLMAQARHGMTDTEGALQELSVLIAHFGRFPAASVQLRMDSARLLVKLEEVSAGLALLQGLPPSLSLEDLAEVELLRAEILLELGNALLAVRIYDAMIDRYSGSPLVLGRAREAREEALKKGPDPKTEQRQLETMSHADDPELAVEGLLGLARLALANENPALAVSQYEEVTSRFSDRPELTISATLGLAELTLSTGDVERAAAILKSAEERATLVEHRVVLREALSDAWQGAGDYGKAQAALQRTLSEQGGDPSYVVRTELHIAGVLDRAGDVVGAQALYGRVAMTDVDPLISAAAFFGEATLLRRIGKGDAALPMMDQAMVILPTQNSLRGVIAVERAELLVELGRGSVGEVESMLAEARDVGFDREQPEAFAELLLLLANEMMAEGREEDGLRIYQRVKSSAEASTSPSLSQASLEGEVAALVALGRKDQADALLQKTTVTDVIGAEPGEGCTARLSLARGRAETGDLTSLVADFTEILGNCAAPRFLVENLPVMADLLVEAGASEQALALLSASRDDAKSPAGRQAAELELGRLGSVEDLVAASEGPDPALAALARVARAELLAEAGRLAEAEPLWAQVVADPSGEPVPKSLALLGLARLEVARGRAEAAQARLAEVRGLSTDQWVLARASQIEGELAGPSESVAPGTEGSQAPSVAE